MKELVGFRVCSASWAMIFNTKFPSEMILSYNDFVVPEAKPFPYAQHQGQKRCMWRICRHLKQKPIIGYKRPLDGYIP